MIKHQAVGVALDLETASTRASGVVVAVGLAAFSVQGGLIRTAQFAVDYHIQEADGRHVCPNTIKWWQNQTEKCREQLDASKDVMAVHPAAVANKIKHFMDGLNVKAVYGYGADFDNAMIQDLCKQYGSDPYFYRLNRCGRTLLAGRRLLGKGGASHVAVEDAIWLAENLRDMFLFTGGEIA